MRIKTHLILNIVLCGIASIPSLAASIDERQWIYIPEKRSVVFGTPDSGDLMVEFQCVRWNKISNMWALNNDTRRFTKGQHIRVGVVSDNKNSLDKISIEGKVEHYEFADQWWLVADGFVNTNDPIFKFLKWSAPLHVLGTGMTYDLLLNNSYNIDRFIRACSSKR